MSGADEVRSAFHSAVVYAFPRPSTDAAASAAQRSSQTEGSAGSTAAGEDGGHGGGRDGGRNGGAGDDAAGGPKKLDLELAAYPLTDLGNAERMAERYRALLRFCPAIGWLMWDGRRWGRQGAEEAVKLAEHATARAIQDEADALEETPGADLCLKEATFYVKGEKAGEEKTPPVFLSNRLRMWGRDTESAQRLAAMSKRAGAMLAIAVEALDRDPMKINVLNGTLHVAKAHSDGYVRLKAHDPGDYITRLAPVTYDPEAACPLYDRFLEEIQSEAEMRAFINMWFGYSLTGDTGEQKMAFLWGTGRNGKGVLVNTMMHVAGGYADSIPIESFLDSGRARAAGQATPDLADLDGVRLLSTSEPKKGAKLDEALIKLFTGGDPIKARHLNKGFFSFVPDAKLTMQGNYKPNIRDSDEGMWSRVKLVPFTVTIARDKRDPKLFDKLKAESSGIFNRLLDGLRGWLDAGALRFPEEVEEATAQYRAECDPVGRFIEECTVKAEDGRIPAARLHEVFVAWAKANGEAVWSAKGLGGALIDRGWRRKKSDGHHWIGVKLTKGVMDFDGGTNGGGTGDHYQPPGEPYDDER